MGGSKDQRWSTTGVFLWPIVLYDERDDRGITWTKGEIEKCDWLEYVVDSMRDGSKGLTDLTYDESK
jgi:hypothetical protein